MQRSRTLPWALTSLRIALLPFFLLLFLNSQLFSCLVLFLFLCFTDLADGFAARKLHVTSEVDAYFDATADCILILCAFLCFAAEGFYPFWVSAFIVIEFAQFVFSSLYSKRIYDPVGKYYGGFLCIIVAVTLAFPYQFVCTTLAVAFSVFTAISLTCRVAYFKGFFAQPST